MIMAFEQINPTSLKYALNSCKNSLNNGVTEELITSIMNDTVWYCNARINLKKALETNNDLYIDLEKEIDHFLNVASQIERYKEIESEINTLNQNYKDLEDKLWVEEEYEDWYFDEEKKEWDYEIETREVKDENVERQMNETMKKINDNQNSLNTLENTIKNMV